MRTVHVHWFRRRIQGSCVLLGCLHFCECFSMRYCFTEMHCERFKKNDLQCISFSFATVVNVFKCMICNAFECFQNALKSKNEPVTCTAYPWCNQYKSAYETKFICLLPRLENKPTPATDTMNRCKSFLGTTAAQILWCSESACASKSANWWLKERDEELEEQEDE